MFSLGQEIHDPRTGRSLGKLEEIKGKGRVIHVQERISTIQTYEFDTVLENPIIAVATFRKERRVYREFVDVQRGDYARRIG